MLITGDWHLGKIINNYSLLEQQKQVVEQIKGQAIDNNVDAVIITGDIYDRAIPPKEAIAVFDAFVTELVGKKKIRVIAIAGNHDSQERLSFGSGLLSETGYHIASKYDGRIERVTLHDDFGPVHVHLIPFLSYQEVRAILKDESIDSYHTAYQRMLEAETIDTSERNVLVTHAYVVSNTVMPETSDSEKMLALGGIDYVDRDLFKDFDFVALGHMHKPQKIGDPNNRYSGSIMKYSFSEANHKKSTILLDLKAKHDTTYELLPLRSKPDLVVIQDYFANIIGDKERLSAHRNDYVKIILEDEKEILEPVPRLKEVLPLIMEFKYAYPRAFAIERSLMSESLAEQLHGKEKTRFPELVLNMFEDFAAKTASYELNEKERALIQDAVQQLIKEEGQS
ncbi:MAG: exonuclease SbcCD subunit D [Acholeplasmataceae bacterium]